MESICVQEITGRLGRIVSNFVTSNQKRHTSILHEYAALHFSVALTFDLWSNISSNDITFICQT